jgi:hypothetical protein
VDSDHRRSDCRLDGLGFIHRAFGNAAITVPKNFRSHTLGYQCHPPGFLAWSTPEWTVVSGGQSDRLPSINQAFSAQGSRVLHTAEDGAVSISIAGGQVSVKGFVGAR